jgi:plastocyanin
MWKFALGAVLALPLTAGAAHGATVDISITKTAYAPSSASLSTTDTVKFTNNDTTVHQVTFKSTTGVACSPSPFTLQPAQSGTCTFTSAGTFSFSDPASAALQGSLTVTQPAPPATLTLFAQPDGAIYANRVTLTGELSTRKAGENVVVLATPCGRSEPTKAATMQTTSGGEYTIGLRPGRNTVYTVQAGATKSPEVAVKVSPRLRLGRVGAHRYTLRVFAAQKFAGRYATFQRYDAGSGRWVFVKRVRLHSNSTNILPTVISSVAFRSAIKPGTRIRAFLPRLQAGGCYQPGTSNVIRS